MDKIKKYTNDEITVIWQADLCIHCGKCAKGLSEVFKPQERPWVDMTGATTEQIVEQVEKCPSGALSLEYNEEEKDETWDATPIEGTPDVEVIPNGPLMVYGDISIKDKEGKLIQKTKRTAFCRCGASANKPFCDGAHRSIVFDD